MILTLSVVSATESNSTDKNSVSPIKSNDTTNLKGASANTKSNSASYTTLQNQISKSKSSITLKTNYKYTSSDSENGIVLNKNNMVIDGKGHVIDGSAKARVFAVAAKNVVLKNMVIINGKSNLGGAIGFVKGASLTTINVTFRNNYATEAGCVFVDSGCKYTSINDKFINCNSKTEGVITSYDASVNIKKGYFKSSSMLQKGFISSAGNSRIEVSDSTFTDTKSKYSTAIFGDAYTSIKNTKFINLESNLTGGAIVLKEQNKTLIINNCEFRNVTSQNNGGAIYVDAPGSSRTKGTTTIKNTKFINCRSKFGGAILQLGGKLIIDKTIFNNNKAIYDGGAVYTSAANTTITNSEFNNNKNILSDYSGSAVYFDYGYLTIKNSKFNRNTPGIAAIHLYDAKYNIVGNTFNSNKMAVYAVFSTGTIKSNKLNGDKTSLKNTDYATYIADNGINITVKNPAKGVKKLPAKFDSRKLGYVTPVKNQGEKNSCWAFGVNAAVESSLLKTTKQKYDLSENTVVNTRLQYSKFGEKNTVEFNDIEESNGHLVSWLGTFSQEYDPYDEYGKISELSATEDNIHIQDIIVIPGNSANTMYAMKDAIYKYGAIAGSIYGSSNKQYYNAQKASFYSYGNEKINHIICIVGWDDNYSKYNFATTPKANGAWIVKNSYGTNYGDKGYIYVSYYDTSIYKEDKTAYPFINTVKYNKNYQTDLLGKIDYLTPNEGNIIHYANTYNMTENDYLGAVGTWFKTKGVKYSFRIVVNDRTVHQQNGISPFIGYSTIKLTKLIPVKANDEVQIIFTSNAVPIERFSRSHYQKDQSIYSVTGTEWRDLVYSNWTAVLKLYTVDKTSIVKNTKQAISKKGYSAILYDGTGKELANTEVKFVVNDKEYTTKTNEHGVATLNTNFDNEKYKIEIINPDTEEIFYDYLDFEEYDDSNPYIAYHTNHRINSHVNKQSQKHITQSAKNIQGKTSTISYNPNDYYKAKFYDNNGNILKNAKVKFIIDGKEYEKTTDDNGIALLDTLSVGKHTITIINEETGEEVTYEIEVKGPIVENHDLECNENDNATFKVRIINDDGTPVNSGEIVVFKINDKPYEAKTDENGYASIEIKEKTGTYNITTSYNNYTVTNKLTVK